MWGHVNENVALSLSPSLKVALLTFQNSSLSHSPCLKGKWAKPRNLMTNEYIFPTQKEGSLFT
jgi:hypothetical protein